MSNRIYPTWEQINAMHSPLTAGERTLLEYLDRNLPEDLRWTESQPLTEYHGWLIFAQPYLNGTRPDIIIFNPFVGVVIYEVKDWDLKAYSYDKKEHRLQVTNGSRWYDVNSPMRQVNHYKNVLVGQLVAGLGEIIDDNNKNFGLIKTMVYFHHASTTDCRNFFYEQGDKEEKYIFGFDALATSDKITVVCPDVRINTSILWKKDWNDELLFWFKPPLHSIEQGTVLTLKGKQGIVATTQSGHYRVRGVAGSGKTQALAYRAACLASQGKRVLVLTFNITLWHYIKDMIARAPFEFEWCRITFNYFHGLCHDVLNSLDEQWPQGDGDDFFLYTLPTYVSEHLTKHNYFGNYDAILIDEGQDFVFEWYELLCNYFLNSHDELVVVCDKRQNIYERDLNWLDKRVTRKGLEKFGDYIDLPICYRMPPRVAEFTGKFADAFNISTDVKPEKNTEPTLPFDHIIWKNKSANDDYKLIALQTYKFLKSQNQSASDIIFLLPNHKMGLELVDYFKQYKIEVNHVFSEDSGVQKRYKKSFWMGDSRLKMCTIQSFKGWELQNVVIFITPQAMKMIDLWGENPEDAFDKLIYTAITRVKCNLIVYNYEAKYNEFGSQFDKKWTDQ